jgi:hypothetical protein
VLRIGASLRDWLDAGLLVTGGTDNPAVVYDAAHPLMGIHVAVTGRRACFHDRSIGGRWVAAYCAIWVRYRHAELASGQPDRPTFPRRSVLITCLVLRVTQDERGGVTQDEHARSDIPGA